MSLSYLSPYISKTCSKLTRNLTECIKLKLFRSPYANQRFLCQNLHENSKSKQEQFIPFNEVVNERRLQASKSIIVQVQSAQSYKELHAYCSTIGTVKNMLHYSSGVEPMHFIIVEFSDETDVQNILSRSAYVEDTHVIPIQSTFLWFKACNKGSRKLKASESAKLIIQNGTHTPPDTEVKDALKNEKNISTQMIRLHDMTKLNDIGTRLRFLLAKQVETALSGMFPNALAHPFGSSVNGYGKMGCDLDLVLKLNEESKMMEDSRLVFHCKAATSSERSMCQRHMEVIGDMLHLFLPGCSQVRKILQARVPIIKYYQQLADIECDLSMVNMSGVYMSDLLYLLGEIDERVRPLVFTVRKWAYEVGLTNSSPGRWITNFSLTLLVLAFLQKPDSSAPILPTLNSLIKSAGPQDSYITEDGINCSFARDAGKLNFQTRNQDNPQLLLQQFFEYYSQFDFTSKAICLNEGIPITKPEHSPLYIVNPLERGLNVSKNVSLDELEKFKLELRNAAWVLESQEHKQVNWGILSLFDSKRKSNIAMLLPRQAKLIEVSALFDEDTESVSQENTESVEVKSRDAGNQIKKIQRETRSRLKPIESTGKSIEKFSKRKSRR